MNTVAVATALLVGVILVVPKSAHARLVGDTADISSVQTFFGVSTDTTLAHPTSLLPVRTTTTLEA